MDGSRHANGIGVKVINELKKLYRRIDRQCPVIGSWLRRLAGRDRLHNVRKTIHGHNNVISYRNVSLNAVHFDIAGKDNHIDISDNCTLNGVTFHIRGDRHHISIGPKCRFNSRGSIWIEDHDCTLSIGEGSTFEEVDFALSEPGSCIDIGRDCMFAYNTEVKTGDSHAILSAQDNTRLNYAKDVHIADHVWVGAHSIILKGVKINTNFVVAAGSIVTRKFNKPGIIIGGNPAKEIKDGITWSRERIVDAPPKIT